MLLHHMTISNLHLNPPKELKLTFAIVIDNKHQLWFGVIDIYLNKMYRGGFIRSLG